MSRKVTATVVLFFFLVFVAGFLLPADIGYSEGISVYAPPEYVFEELNEVNRWPSWSYWHAHDTSFKLYPGARRKGAGIVSGWITASDSGNIIVLNSVHLDSLGAVVNRRNGISGALWGTVKYDSSATALEIGAELPFPDTYWERWRTFLFRRPLAKRIIDYHLTSIKAVAEAKPVFKATITEESLAPLYYVSQAARSTDSDRVSILRIQQQLHKTLLNRITEGNTIKTPGSFCFLEEKTGDGTMITFCIPVSPDTDLPGEVIRQRYSGPAVRGIHRGDPLNLPTTHSEVVRYIEYKNYRRAGPPWEVYRSGLPDSNDENLNWIADVYYPVEQIIF